MPSMPRRSKPTERVGATWKNTPLAIKFYSRLTGCRSGRSLRVPAWDTRRSLLGRSRSHERKAMLIRYA
ncbi:TPA: hypothetical protein N0F65_002677 [Lagenidium giganteum]|uniref:Uncharacterized protein n=1 Tax=Lagenidium giganteum TaxID=4803 RepID=A0AAV2Z5Q6_9STRA|nr:TPA: hypothetical protein N0F65_002677 [Lagenidium giganteum]